MADKRGMLIIFVLIGFSGAQLFSENKANPRMLCPQLYQKAFRGYVPKGNFSAGTYVEKPELTTLKGCVVECCRAKDCNVAFMYDRKCYHVTCISNDLCLPIPTPNVDSFDRVSMVLVKPVPEDDSWDDVIHQEEYRDRENINEEFLMNALNNHFKNSFDPLNFDDPKELMQMDESAFSNIRGCEVGVDASCTHNEICAQNNPKSRAGTCKCKIGFARSSQGVCVLAVQFKDEVAINGLPEGFSEHIINLNATKKQLVVGADNKQVKLPVTEVSLTASVSPPPGEEEKYQYEWTSLHQPEGSSAVKTQSSEQLKLTNLSEGLYTFKLTVTSPDAYGETFVNVTVLPPSRINQPPQIIITPANQTIKLPNTGAVLDASASTDDDRIVSWHWELQQGPLGYNPQLVDLATLQLNDLSKPGNYTFKLTVTDSDKATNTSMATISVLKYTDYPPEANAGQDEIIYLPHSKITLNGNLSTDDHNITTWEWTKSPDDADKAVDMQDTRTPYLRLSDLEEGMYTFVLKVTDSANQSSTAQVRVFVKPPTNQPPVADAGDNTTISLPQTWVMVNANRSKDDNKIASFKWEQVSGPSNAVFVNPNSSISNVTGLTKGNYVFKVDVTDDNNNVASSSVYLTVNQNKNQKPKADAGGNLEINLPRTTVYINGSKSSDDWAIVKWQWTRNDYSLAIGNLAEKSDESPILIVADLQPGKYIFNLTVFDEQGLSDTDTMTLTVDPDPMLFYLVDITIDNLVKQLTEMQYNSFKGKLALLVKDGTKLQVRSLKPQKGTYKSIITFYVETSDGKPVPANEVVHHLRQKLRVDASLLGFSVNQLQTHICQNNCSGHGVCNVETRKCICEAFWMQDLFKVYFRTGEDSDCSWSILYVVLGVLCSMLILVGTIWGTIFLCVSWCSRRRSMSKPTTYKLIEDTDELPPFASRKADMSDSDTDSDVVFESRNKPLSRYNSDNRNGYKSRNGFTKMGRRIKT